VNNLAIDALGRDCTPGYTLAHGLGSYTASGDYFPPVTHLSALHGYAVLIPDHEGPRMAYAEPYVAGHAVLDAIRATRNVLPDTLGHSLFAMTGYSGGAIATYAAAKLLDSYAPDLRGSVVGAALGGVPADFALLTRTMNGNWASAVFAAAVFGIGRERPEILGEMNHLAEWVATSVLKDQCFGTFAPAGVVSLPIDIAANVTDPLKSGVARQILRDTALTGRKSAMPLFIYNGDQDWWIPAAGARALFREQCALGVTAEYRGVAGEHLIGGWLGFLPSMNWLDDRLHSLPAPDNC
jgi:pimeloyl-ACP methyl ester carboxylesterase